MTELFTPGWAESLGERMAAIEPGTGGTGVVEWVVSGGDPDHIWIRWDVADGRVTQVKIFDAAGTDDEVDTTVPLTRANAEAVIAGEIDPAQAYMRGDLKPEGSSGAWFALLSAWARPEVRQALTGTGSG